MELKDCFSKLSGDRYDAWRIRNIDPVYSLMPYLQPTRVDSMCFFDETIDLENLEAFVLNHRADLPGLSLMHIVLAAIVRTLSQRPQSNRFLIRNKLYAHNDIRIALMIKREMTESGVETPIIPSFNPKDTLRDVVEKVNKEVFANKGDSGQNSSDKFSEFLGKLPPFLLRFVVWCVTHLDYIGLFPKDMYIASPYHCSVFLTNLGSLGVGPVYHHLYEFGTCSFFIAMGRKIREVGIDKEGNRVQRKSIGLRFTMDERVSDGRYHAMTVRYMRKLLNEPESLLLPPEKVVLDDGIGRPPIGEPTN